MRIAEYKDGKMIYRDYTPEAVAQFSGNNATEVKKMPISVNRYFGRWIGTTTYNAINYCRRRRKEFRRKCEQY